jgi:chromosomal replication initiator protein
VSAELEHIWSRVQAELALAVGEPTYRIWLEPLRPLELSGDRLLIEAPPHACGWIRDRFGRVLQAGAALVLGPGAVVDLVAGPSSIEVSRTPATIGHAGEDSAASSEGGRAHPHATRRAPQTAPGDHRPHELSLTSPSGPLGNPKLTFDQFVIGDCNRLAHAAALTVAEMPAQSYNPLFICGPPGVGKTHLLNSIASLLLSHSPGLTVRCTTGEAFTNAFLTALSGGQTEGFKARFRHIDVLLVDDVQFLERKAKTEEEFFHTFNALHDGGRQIVLTSDRPPYDLQALEDRLRERFEAGLVADIKPPSLPTRLAILRKRAHHDHIDLADDLALGVIAERIESNVRALEGALIRVVAFSSLTGRPLTADLAREVLNSLYPSTAPSGHRRPRSVAEIQAATCEHFGLSPEELLSTARTPRIAWPRQVAMYLARELTEESLPAIGRHFGGRDHTTVLHAWRRATARIAGESSCREVVDKLRSDLDSNPSQPPPRAIDRRA